MDKLIFSPGPVPTEEIIKINFSHRSDEFKKLYKQTKDKLRLMLNIPDEYNILFIQGSGTSAIETVLSSLDSQLYPYVVKSGIFGERADIIANRYSIASYYSNIGKYLYYCQFETSQSQYTNLDNMYDKYDLVIVDSVSSLGFYDLPKADIIIGSSSKILGGLPVMGIVLYNKKAEGYFRNKGDYLNIIKYIEYDKSNQTPHTSLIPQILSLNNSLGKLITKQEIERNCHVFEGLKEYIVGDNICPVLILKIPNTTQLIQYLINNNIEVYYNPSYMKDYFQISMFNYKDIENYIYVKELIETWLKQ